MTVLGLFILAFTVTNIAFAEEGKTPALAEEAVEAQSEEAPADPSVTYSPDFCEFGVTFPDEPYTARRCEGEDRSQCYDLVSYTQVYGLSTTVNFRVICNPIGADILEAYSPEVMETTLRALTKNSVVEEFDATYREEDGYKQAGLVGEGHVGRTPTIYLAQLWIGKKSALSLEAELIGDAVGDADKLFGEVLKSVGLQTEDEAKD
ncbi:MAG: hypothetical protein ACRBCT_07510 [Alphaproteobacteria bacterium]